MGSIVIDAVNHFFHPQSATESFGHHQSEARPAAHTPLSSLSQQQQPPLRDTFQSNTPMSVTGSRAASSQVTSSHHSTPSQSARSHTRQRPGKQSPGQSADAHVSAKSQSQSNTRENSPASASSASASSPVPSVSSDETSSSAQRCIKIKDLAHIQSLANSNTEAFPDNGQAFRQKSGDQGPQYEISGMPIENIIEMVAGLLTKITTTNDMQHEHLHRQIPTPDSSTAMSSQTTSVLAFHGKNVPSITILSYLNRINKYCPTSYEVFISLLVYFDRMTEKVNSGPIQNLREMNQQATDRHSDGMRSPPSTQSMEGVTSTGPAPAQTATPPMSGEFEKHRSSMVPGTPHSKPHGLESPVGSSLDTDTLNLSHFFVVDSFNIHRLVIAGVTCASKFFSDIFYTNSRYAKVSH